MAARRQPQVTDNPPEATPEPPRPARDPGRRVAAYDKVSGDKLPYPVPLSHLDGRFPNLSETPSSKAGK